MGWFSFEYIFFLNFGGSPLDCWCGELWALGLCCCLWLFETSCSIAHGRIVTGRMKPMLRACYSNAALLLWLNHHPMHIITVYCLPCSQINQALCRGGRKKQLFNLAGGKISLGSLILQSHFCISGKTTSLAFHPWGSWSGTLLGFFFGGKCLSGLCFR